MAMLFLRMEDAFKMCNVYDCKTTFSFMAGEFIGIIKVWIAMAVCNVSIGQIRIHFKM